MARLFISYSRKDIEVARKLTEAAKNDGLDIWIDWEGIPPTVEWWKEIEKGIEGTDIFLFLISPDSAGSKVCRQEIAHAAKNGKRLIPVVVRDIKADECPPELGALNWIFLREQDDFDLEFKRLITAVHTNYPWVEAHRDLQLSALKWERNNHGNSSLLRGKELQDAEFQLAKNSLTEPYPTNLQREYVLKSRQVSDRQRRVTRWVAVAVIIALAALAVFGFVQAGLATANARTAEAASTQAISNAQEAEKQATIALARQLEAQAISFADRQLDRALLLSLEARRLYPSDEANRNLLNLLEGNPKLEYYVHAHPDYVRAVRFNLDGSRFASGSQDGTIRVWESESARQIGNFNVDPAASLAFSQDLKILAVGHQNGTIELWEVETGKQIRSLQHNEAEIRSLAFSPDGHVLATGSFDATISLWNVETGELLFQPLQGHTDLIDSLAFSANGEWLASGDDQSIIILWDLSNGQPIHIWPRVHISWILSLAFSPDGKTLASSSGDHTIILWDLQDYKQIAQLRGHASFVHDLAFSPDGRILASAGRDRRIILWDAKTGQPIDEPLRGHTGDVFCLAFHPDGQRLISGGSNGAVIKWNIDGSIRTWTVLMEKTSRIFSVALGPDGKTLAAADLRDGSIVLWDLERRKQIEPLLVGHEDRVRSLAFSPNGKLLASASNDRTVRLWDLESYKELKALEGHEKEVVTIAFSRDGKFLASGSTDPTIIIWSMETFQIVRKLGNPHGGSLTSVAFSPDGQMLVSGGQDRTIWLWNLNTGAGTQIEMSQKELGLVYSVAFHPAGQQFVSGNSMGVIHLWDVSERKPIGLPLSEHFAGVYRVVYDPKQEYLASGGLDGTVILWDLTSFQVIAQFQVSRERVTSVALSSDERRRRTLAAGICDRKKPDGSCLDGKVMVWDLDPSNWEELACQIAGRNLSQPEWKVYFDENLPYHVTCPQWPAGE